jgi:hypothetical protein
VILPLLELQAGGRQRCRMPIRGSLAVLSDLGMRCIGTPAEEKLSMSDLNVGLACFIICSKVASLETDMVAGPSDDEAGAASQCWCLSNGVHCATTWIMVCAP